MSVQKIALFLGIAGLLTSGSAAFARNGLDDGLNLNTKIEHSLEIRHRDDDTNKEVEINDDTGVRSGGRINWSFDPGIIGTVTAVNGSTITVKAGPNGSSYTVDASAVTITNIAVGDRVLVQGAINGISVVASSITETKGKSAIKNNLTGVVGRVTAISGSTITVVGKNDISYTVNAANAKVWKNKNHTAQLADIALGDTIIVQGTVNGTSVTASNIIDVKLPIGEGQTVLTGTVTAVSDTTLTVKSSDGTIYTVATAGAQIKDHKDKDEDKNTIAVGDTVTIKGSIDGTMVTATTIIEGNAKVTIFQRLGAFLKTLFGKK